MTRIAIASLLLCLGASALAATTKPSESHLEGNWISQQGAEYRISGDQMVCRKIPLHLRPKFESWLGKVRVKNIRPMQAQNSFTGMHAKRELETGEVLNWFDCELQLEGSYLRISFTNDAGKALSLSFKRAIPYLSGAVVFLSFLVGIACIKYIREFDLYEKEPFITMLAATCWGGVWSVGLSLLFYRAVHGLGVGDLSNPLGAFLVIGPAEELAKLLAFLSCYWFLKKDLNEPVDGIIYMACVALGFSIIENYFYVVRADNPAQVMVLRLAMSTPMHISFSAFMGLACYLITRTKVAVFLLFLAYLYASFAHGVYNAVIFTGWALVFLLIVIKVAHSWTLALLSYSTARSPYRRSLKTFISTYPSPTVEPGIECLHCGDTDPKTTYRLGKSFVQKCGHCDHYVTTKSGLLKLFSFFAAMFKEFPAVHYWRPSITGEKYSTLYKGNWLSEQKEIAYFSLDDLSDAIDELTRETVKKLEDRWWFPSSAFEQPDGVRT